MEDKINLLISTLKVIDTDTFIEVHNEFFDNYNPLVIAVRYLANECLIGDDGHPLREEMDKVSSAGFSIFPGEMDRFGWLTGCIQLTRGTIVFG
jgi:hypothetical protein